MAKAGQAYSFTVSLFDSDGAIVASPTLAAGDVLVVKDDDSVANITTLPSVTSASSGVLNVALSAAEMAGSAGGTVTVKFVDASGAEWLPVTISIPLTGSDIDTVDGIVDDILTDTGTTLQNELDGIQADTEDIQTQIGAAGAGLTAIPWNAAWDAEVESEATDALNAYDPPTKAELDSGLATVATAAALATVDTNVDAILVDTDTTIPGLIAALNDLSAADVNAEVVDVIRTDTIPDSVATDGSASTIAQAIYLMLQFLTDFAISGTTYTVRKPDGSTSLATFTLDDDTNPTAITRTT